MALRARRAALGKLAMRSPGLLCCGLNFGCEAYIMLWTTPEADPTDPKIVRNEQYGSRCF